MRVDEDDAPYHGRKEFDSDKSMRVVGDDAPYHGSNKFAWTKLMTTTQNSQATTRAMVRSIAMATLDEYRETRSRPQEPSLQITDVHPQTDLGAHLRAHLGCIVALHGL